MLYILEGCDGAGKTTLATSLQKLLDAEIIHCTVTTPNDFVFFSQISDAARDRNIIADRFCYGQFVYQTNEYNRPLYNRKDDSIKTLGYLEAKLIENGTKVIYVYANPEELKERLEMRGEILLNGLSVEDILNKYAAIRKMSMLQWIDWYTGKEEEK